MARTAGAALSPSLVGMMLAVPALVSAPFLVSGGLKLSYDGLLWRSFRTRPVVITTRVPNGRVLPNYGWEGGGKTLVDAGAVMGDDLPA